MARTIFDDVDPYILFSDAELRIRDYEYDLARKNAELYWHNHHQYRNVANGRERAITVDVETPEHQITMWDRIMYVKCKIMVRFGQWLIRITL